VKLEFSRQIYEKYSNIKCYENPSSVNPVVPCGQTDGQTDMTKLIVAFRHFANAPEKKTLSHCHFVLHKAEMDCAGIEPVLQVLVNIQKFGTYLMADTHSPNYKFAIRRPRCVFSNEYRCGKDV
jgi:hypothetical protein